LIEKKLLRYEGNMVYFMAFDKPKIEVACHSSSLISSQNIIYKTEIISKNKDEIIIDFFIQKKREI